MKNIVIGITGKIGSGKSTFATMVQKELEQRYKWLYSKPVVIQPMAQKLKDIVATMCGLPNAALFENQDFKKLRSGIIVDGRDITYRELLQLVGTESLRTLAKDIHCQMWKMELRNVSLETIVIVPDIRFDNEAEFLISEYDASIVYINRPNFSNDVGADHVSESGINPNYYTFDVRNETLDNLEHAARALVDHNSEVIRAKFIDIPSPKIKYA